MPKTIAITPSWYWPHGVARVVGVPPFALHEYLVERWARHQPAETALVDASTRLTGADLVTQVQAAAAGLAGLIAEDETVALCAGASVEGVVLVLGAAAAGRRIRLVDPASPSGAGGHRVTLADAPGAAAVASVGIEAVRLASLTTGTAPAPAVVAPRTAAVGLPSDDTVAWHSHRSLLAGALSFATFTEAGPARPWLSMASLARWDGLYAVLVPLAAGAGVVLAEGPEPALEAIGREGVGSVWLDLDTAFSLTKDAKRQVKHLRGALERLILTVPGAFAQDQRQRVGRSFECPALTVWGRPETGPIFASHPSWYLDESVGIPSTNVHVVPVDAHSGQPVATLWELVESAMVTAWSPSMCLGYEGGAHPERFAQGRFVTGTSASSDANGMIYLLPD